MESYELKRGAFKNLTLRIHPDGNLRVSAPWFVPRWMVDRFVGEKADWIARKRQSLQGQTQAPERPTVLDGVMVWGAPQKLRVQSPGRLPRVVHDLATGEVILRVPASWDAKRQRRLLDVWEKDRVTEALKVLVDHWSARMGLSVTRWTVKRMRSRWGSCQPATRSLVFNSRLGALPPACLEHVVVHELVHLVEKSHNARFHALVEQWLPGSKAVRALLKAGTGTVDSGVSPTPPSTPEAGTRLATLGG